MFEIFTGGSLSWRISNSVLLTVALSLSSSESLEAAMMQFQNSVDTTLIQDNGDSNYGARSEILLGATGGGRQRAGLIAFDVSSLAGQYQSVDSVSITFVVARTATSTNSYGLRLMREANNGWVEGTSNGGSPEPGTATWNQLANGTPGIDWAGGFGSGARFNGTDNYGDMGNMTFTAGTTMVDDVITIPLNVSGYPSNVNTWTEIFDLWTSGTNAGIQIYGGNGQWGVYSAQATTGIGVTGTLAQRPILNVEYTAIPEPSTAMLGALALVGLAWTYRQS